MSTGAVLAATYPNPTPSDFGNDPWWLSLIKAVVIFVVLVVVTILTIWAERRVVGFMQARKGPNRTGPFGILQGLVDGVKLALKEDIIPVLADRPVFLIAPVISVIPAFLAWAVIPMGGAVSIAGHQTALQLTDLPVAVFLILACSSFGVYGIVLAGWSSGSTYPLLGSLRSAAQVISYEVALGLSLIPVALLSGTLSTSEIVTAQDKLWYVIILLPSFVIYFVSGLGETNRAPFDLPEGESEIVGGFHTEYSSLRFALFFLAEYINMVTVSAVAVTLFFGGWHAPWLLNQVPVLDSAWFGLVWFWLKVCAFLFLFIWIRGSLPRLRYDQFMRLGWKVLIPVGLMWLVFVSAARARANGSLTWSQFMIWVGIPLAAALVAYFVWAERRDRAAAQPVDDEPEPPESAAAGSYPLPVFQVDAGGDGPVGTDREAALTAAGSVDNADDRQRSPWGRDADDA